MKKQKLIAIVLVVLLLAVSLASCFASADGSAASGASSSAPAPTAAPAEDQSADIVVIGAGGAGMTAAIQAVHQARPTPHPRFPIPRNLPRHNHNRPDCHCPWS